MNRSSLFNVHTAVIERQDVDSTASMGSQKTYSQANRGTLPRSIRCRIVEMSVKQRQEYAMRDIQATDVIYTQDCDPQVDERDRLTHDGDTFYVRGVRNPDRLNAYWIVACERFSGGPK